MATRSDFAQKLLIDLRMRKERMSTPSSHSTSNSKGTPRDSYGNPSQHHKGSRQTKSLELVGTRPTNSHKRSNHGARSLVSEESSKQLVPYGGGRNSKQIGDLSSALALAFGNNKKFIKLNNSSSNNPILSFLHRIGRRALEIGKMERRNITSFNKPSSQIINVSNLHINEISKGVQKLNQILKGYSNSITFDGYSVEIGRELLKGAMDLEEMLANIQDDSNQVTSSRKKSQIKLLNEKGEEEEEEESESVPQKKLIERPRFSFDNPSKNSKDAKQVLKSDPKRSLIALNYTTEDMPLFRKQPSRPSSTSDVAHHKRSASCGPEFRPQNGKIPNVIAKLMGLEELPQSVNFESTPSRSSSKQKEGMVLKNNENINGKIVEKMVDNVEYVAPTDSGRKVMQNNNGFKFQNAKSLLKDKEIVGVRKPASGQLNEEFRRFNKSPNNLHVNMRRKEAEKHNEYIGVEKGEAKVAVDRNNKYAEAKIIRKGTSGVRLEKEKRNTDREENSRVEKREKQHMKENQVVPCKTTPKKLHEEKPYKVSTNSNLLVNGSSKNLTANTRNLMFYKSCRSGTPNKTVSKTKNSRGPNPPIKKDHPVNSIERESLQKKDKVVTKREVTQEKGAVTLTDQISFLQKKEQVKLGKSIEGEAEILINNNSKDAEMHIVNHDTSEASAKVLNDDLPSDQKANELHSPIVVPDLPTLDESSQNMTIKISIDPIDDEDHLASLNEDTGLESQKFELDSGNGCIEADVDNSIPQQHEQKENPIPEIDEILIESEINLKQTLLKSQLFLNTVNALFNFSIPIDFLSSTDNIIQDDDNKLMLDCAYELTRKKGKRLELSLYPSIKIATVSVKITSFNDLVKQLHTNFEKLKFVYEGTNEEQDSAEFIQEMLEIDVENRDTDVNAMWDLGWNGIMFAMIERDELIKDVEKYLIDVVIEDIAKELLYLGGYI